jgi:hypothetical protein
MFRLCVFRVCLASYLAMLKSLSISFVGLLLLTFSAWAGASALEGVVKDPAGHPVKGADVRIEAFFARLSASPFCL